MNRRLIELINLHEEQDYDKMVFNLPQAVADELENADWLIQKMAELGITAIDTSASDLFHIIEEIVRPQKSGYTENSIENSARGAPLPLGAIFTRKASVFDIRKHTAVVVPYFHSHSYYELIYVYKGSLLQYIDSTDNIRTLCEGELCLLAPGAVHALNRPSGGDIVLKISLPTQLMCRLADNIAQLKSIKSGSISYYNAPPLRLEGLVSGLLDEAINRKENTELAIESYLSLIFIELFREQPVIIDEMLLTRAMSYIKSDYVSATAAGLALQLGYSAGHTDRLLRKGVGMSFGELLKKARMQKAAKQLTETDLSVEQIARSLGYESLPGFYKQFTKSFNTTPTKYRRAMRDV